MIVDAHAHVFSPSARPRRGGLARWRGDASVAALLREMDAAGVGRAILAPVGPDPAVVLATRRQNPVRFGAVTLPPDPTAPARPAFGGYDGVRLHHLGAPGASALDELGQAGLLRSMAADRLVLSFFGDRVQLANLEVMLRELPRLPVMINHLGAALDAFRVDDTGRPSLRGAGALDTLPLVERYARYPQVTVALSGLYALSDAAYPYLDLRPTVERLAAAYGARRLLWGSDFPWISAEPGYARSLELIDHQLPGLTWGERAAILGDNAAELFGRAATTTSAAAGEWSQ